MCLARPCTTASVTLTSGCSDVPDFSAYFRAYVHILSTFAWDGSAIHVSCGRRWADHRAPEPCEGAPTANQEAANASSIFAGLKPLRRLSPMRITGSDVR